MYRQKYGLFVHMLCRLYIGCDGVRLPSQNCGLEPIVLSPGDSDVNLVDEIG
jgi:hypothetical protein